jgi:hypothetical protein
MSLELIAKKLGLDASPVSKTLINGAKFVRRLQPSAPRPLPAGNREQWVVRIIWGVDIEDRAKFLGFDSAQCNGQSRKQGMDQRPG